LFLTEMIAVAAVVWIHPVRNWSIRKYWVNSGIVLQINATIVLYDVLISYWCLALHELGEHTHAHHFYIYMCTSLSRFIVGSKEVDASLVSIIALHKWYTIKMQLESAQVSTGCE